MPLYCDRSQANFLRASSANFGGNFVSTLMARANLGRAVRWDSTVAPYEKSHRLITFAATMDGHSSTQAGGVAPNDANGAYVFLPVWQTMYLGQ